MASHTAISNSATTSLFCNESLDGSCSRGHFDQPLSFKKDQPLHCSMYMNTSVSSEFKLPITVTTQETAVTCKRKHNHDHTTGYVTRQKTRLSFHLLENRDRMEINKEYFSGEIDDLWDTFQSQQKLA